MPAPREFIFGPWRAVSVLGVTEIFSWGALFYPPVLTVPLIAADHGWSKSFAMGGFSVGLFVGGLVFTLCRRADRSIWRPRGDAGRVADRRAGLAGLVLAQNSHRLLRGVDGARRRHGGLALRSGLRHARPYLRRERARADHHADARRRLCLHGELAGHAISHRHNGWRGAYLVYAALLALVAAPLHAFALPRRARRDAARAGGDARAGAEARGRAAAARARLSAGRRGVFRPTRSCPRRSRRSFSPSSSASDLRPTSSSPSACCLDRRRSWRASANLALRAICIRCGSRVFPSVFWSRRSRSSCFCIFPRRGRRLCRDVRHGQWADDHCARHRAARVVWRQRLWPARGTHRRTVSGRAGGGAGGLSYVAERASDRRACGGRRVRRGGAYCASPRCGGRSSSSTSCSLANRASISLCEAWPSSLSSRGPCRVCAPSRRVGAPGS